MSFPGKPFSNAAKAFPNDAAALDAAYKTLRAGTFNTPDELRAGFWSLTNFKYKDKWWRYQYRSQQFTALGIY